MKDKNGRGKKRVEAIFKRKEGERTGGREDG